MSKAARKKSERPPRAPRLLTLKKLQRSAKPELLEGWREIAEEIKKNGREAAVRRTLLALAATGKLPDRNIEKLPARDIDLLARAFKDGVVLPMDWPHLLVVWYAMARPFVESMIDLGQELQRYDESVQRGGQRCQAAIL